jgi:hypothetical protein
MLGAEKNAEPGTQTALLPSTRHFCRGSNRTWFRGEADIVQNFGTNDGGQSF